MEYLPGTKIICLTYRELVSKIMTAENFRQLKSRSDRGLTRNGIKVHGRNGIESECLIEYGSLRRQEKEKVVELFGDPREYIAMEPLRALVETDAEARQFYTTYPLPTTGKTLPLEYQLKYARQCDWFGAIKKALTNKGATKEIMQISIGQLWTNFSNLINNDETAHELPTSVDRLQRRYKLYRDGGYAGIVEAWRFGNDHRRVVTPKIEGLILSLRVKQGYAAYMNEVCRQYNKFIMGEEQVVHLETGEVFDPMDFYVVAKGQGKKKKKGDAVLTVPYKLGESTVDYYIKKPGNEAIINKFLMKKQDYDTKYRPSVLRIGAFYAFSKISMDDIDLPFKGPDGDRVVKSYQAYDCASECIVGVSFGKDKGKELILECMRDMFRLIVRKGWGVPWEIEMERHITSHMKGKTDKETGEWTDDLYTPGVVFPATRICQNAQSKRAEGFIRKKKYGYQRKRKGFQGRFYAKNLTNRLNTDQKELRQAYEEIVMKELADIWAYNNELHPKQELYPNLTRWQVLEQHQNPILPKYQAHQVIQFIGYSTATSIRAGVAQVQYGDYMLPDITLIQKTHYTGEITAYYVPDEDGLVQSVFLFEDGQFLCEAKKKMGFHEAVVEQTPEDIGIMEHQWGQQKRFDKMVDEGGKALVPVGVVSPIPALPQGEGVAKRRVKVLEAPNMILPEEVAVPYSKDRANNMF